MRALQRPTRGAVLLGFLVLLAASGWTVAQWAQSAADEHQRQAEAELLWVGQQYRVAILSYYNAAPGGVKRLPTKVEELLEDKRFPTSRRHLRQAYTDPLRPGEPLKLVMRAQQLIGVQSTASGEPFRKAGFDPGLEKFSEAGTYADWQFIAEIRGLGNLPGAAADAASAAGAGGSTNPLGGLGSPGNGFGSSPLNSGPGSDNNRRRPGSIIPGAR